MNRLTVLFIAAMVAVGLQTARAQQAAAQTEKLLASAQHKATIDGDLKGAIEDYKKIVAGAGANRALAAQALVRMAECYQKLGDVEAQKIFRQVVKEYGDQKEAFEAARMHLAREDAPAGVVSRQVWTGPKVDVYGSVSRDGRYLSFVDWSDHGNLGIHDLTTGKDRSLTKNGEAEYSTISRDGKLVAYAWFKRDVSRYEVRLANLTGDPNPRTLFDNEDVLEVSPYDWSPDGKWIAASVRRRDRTAQIGLISSLDGSLRVLKSTDWRGATRMFFSPDGRYVAFDLLSGEAQRDVFVLAVDGSREIPAAVDPNEDRVMGWAPDGRLLFASDRTGSMGLYALRFRDDRMGGQPELLKADIGRFESSMGVTAAGALFFGRTGRSSNVEIVPVDWGAGKVMGSPVNPVKRFEGSNSQPSWTRDAKYLGCISGRDSTGANKILVTVSVETRQVVREVRPKMGFLSMATISPDGRSYVAQGQDLRGRTGIFRVDAESGDVAPLVLIEQPAGDSRPDGIAFRQEWSPDGNKIYFRRVSYNPPTAGLSRIIEKDVTTGTEREVSRGGNGIVPVSPDGRWIATLGGDPASRTSSLMLIPVEGGAPRELLQVPNPQQVRAPAWTPDGRAVIVWKMLGAPAADASIEIWRIPVDGSQPSKLDIDPKAWGIGAAMIERNGAWRLSPDGRYIGFTSAGESTAEVSVLENFLVGARNSGK